MQPLPSLDELADNMYHNYHTQARVHVLMMSLLNILTKFYLIITKDFFKRCCMYQRDNVGWRFLSSTFRKICYTHLKNHSNASINGVGSKLKKGGGLDSSEILKSQKGRFRLWLCLICKKSVGGGRRVLSPQPYSPGYNANEYQIVIWFTCRYL